MRTARRRCRDRLGSARPASPSPASPAVSAAGRRPRSTTPHATARRCPPPLPLKISVAAGTPPARESRFHAEQARVKAAMAAMPKISENTPVLLEAREHGVLRLILNRPQARNALSVALMDALIDALGRAAKDTQARVVVIAGAGQAFCAGHDLREIREDRRRETYERLFAQCSELMLAIVRLPKPVIAEVHGVATAAGCQLVASCDLAVAAEDARFATPGVNIGLFCSTPMVALSRAVGRKAAMEMLLTGELISAARACEIGLVNRVVPGAGLRAAVDTLARESAGKTAFTVAIGKEAFYHQTELDLAAAYRYAAEVMTTNMLASDAGEGIDAFLAKRPPVWQDR